MTLLAGSNIVKGTINDGMDVEFALKFGKALGKIYGSPIAVAMDGRTSNVMLKSALSAGIMSVGSNVIDLGSVPTPIIQYYMGQHPDVKGGVTITASYVDQDINGFRVMGSGGVEDPILDSHTVEEIMEETYQAPAASIGEIFVDEGFIEGYIDSVLSQVDVEAIRAANLKVCVDCRNRAVGPIVEDILMHLSVDSLFISGDSTEMNMDRLIKLGHVVKSQAMDIGVGIEMDADHCMFITAEGEPVQGDKSFAVIAKSILAENKGTVVIPINSTTLMESVVSKNGGTVKYCTIGEQTVVRTVKESDAILGGDIYGCFVLPEHTLVCDALMAMVKMLELVAKDGPLDKQIADMPTYHIRRATIQIPEEEIPVRIERFKMAHDGEEKNLMDGVKLFRDNGWILVRHSNMAGAIKIYVQSDTDETAQAWLDETIAAVSSDS